MFSEYHFLPAFLLERIFSWKIEACIVNSKKESTVLHLTTGICKHARKLLLHFGAWPKKMLSKNHFPSIFPPSHATLKGQLPLHTTNTIISWEGYAMIDLSKFLVGDRCQIFIIPFLWTTFSKDIQIHYTITFTWNRCVASLWSKRRTFQDIVMLYEIAAIPMATLGF